MRSSYYNVHFEIGDDRYLLMNTLVGSIDIVDKDVVNLVSVLRKAKKAKINKNREIVKYLTEKGYITEKARSQETRIAEEFYGELAAQRADSHFILLTYDCNLRCLYCYQHSLRKQWKESLRKTVTEENVDKIFEAIVSLDETNRKMPITICGGEPLLPQTREILEYILQKGIENNYEFVLFTNSVNLKHFAHILNEYKVSLIRTRIEGAKSFHDIKSPKVNGAGSFDEILENIEYARKTGLNVRLEVNIYTLAQIGALNTLHKYFKSLGWYENEKITISISSSICGDPELHVPVLEEFAALPMTEENFKTLLRKVAPLQDFSFAKAIREGAWAPFFSSCLGQQALIYDPFGDIYTCRYLVGQEQFRVGTYLPKLVFNENLKLWRQRNILDIPSCKKCKYAPLCGGGCPYFDFIVNGDLQAPSCQSLVLTLGRLIPEIASLSFPSNHL